MYTVAWSTLCYGWRVGIVKPIVIVTSTAAPNSYLTFTLPYLTLPYLKLILTLAYYIILPLMMQSPAANRLLKDNKPQFFSDGKTEVRSRAG